MCDSPSLQLLTNITTCDNGSSPFATLQMSTDNTPTNGPLEHGVYYTKLLVFIGGCLGNILSVVIWLSPMFRKMPRSIVCISLAVVNTIYLLVIFSLSTTKYFNDEYFLGGSDVTCKIKGTLFGFTQHMDSLLIVFLSLERCVSVFKPHLVKIIFTHTKAAVYVLTIAIIFMAFNVFIAMYDISTMKLQNGESRCQIDQTPRILIRQLLIGPIPLVVIIPCNAVTVVKVIAQYRAMRHVVVITQQHIQKQRALKVTKLTLSITLTFIVLTLPTNVYFLCCRSYSSDVLFVLTLLPMLNASLNFYLYTLASKDYRGKVRVMLNKAYTHVRNFFTSLLCQQNAVVPLQDYEMN